MKYKVVIVALLIWLNILTALYFARAWTEEKNTPLFSYYGLFDNQTETNTFVHQLNFAKYGDGTFDRIDTSISIIPRFIGIMSNGNYYETWNDYFNDNPITIEQQPCTLNYVITGINIIAKDNYVFIFYGLLTIDLIIIASTIFIDRHTKQPECVPRRKRVS